MNGLRHEGTIIRPPSEADSILLQATLGCSHNKCTFCGAYKDKRFAIKPDSDIEADLAFAAKYMTRQRRVFLMDGDAMIIPQKRLVALLQRIRQALPWVLRIGVYANAKSLAMKSFEELKTLRENGLRVVYMGLESGDDATLAAVNKGRTAAQIVEQGRRVREAGIKLNVTVLNGLAGPEGSLRHAEATGEALSEMAPDYIGALSLMLIPGTPLHADWEEGRFQQLSPVQLLQELRAMIAGIHIERGQFFANHASNYLPLKLRLPKDKESALSLLDQGIEGAVALKPEVFRRL